MPNDPPKNIVCIGDATVHGAPIITPGVNTKLSFNNIPFTTLTGSGPPHSPPHVAVLVNIIINANQSKVFFNNIPFAVYGAACSCGDIVCGSLVNPKITIK